MRPIRSLFFLFGGLLLGVSLRGQGVNTMHPPEIDAQKHQSPEELRDRVNNLQLQKDAKELTELCATVPGDMDGVKQGLLPKDLIEKLKRMEKLSKQVRERLTRTSGTH
ncbi:MAG TPA: hypothetical protein VLL05_01220 [Terriglobales bacterium]|nr:hypothetical protein [Terriglobales bacterium]